MFEATWTLLTPSTLLAVLALMTLLGARLRWRGLTVACAGTLVLALLILALTPIDAWAAQPLEDQVAASALPDQVDGIVVLGGSVEWRVTRARGQLSLDDAGERMLGALALARRYPTATLVFTGLFGDALEADWRGSDDRGLLWQPALAGRPVHFLGAAASTYEEAVMARAAVSPKAGETWLLVTSALHMPRASATFRTLGWSVLPVPVDYRTTDPVEWRFEPRIGARLAALDRVAREWGALWVYRRSGRIVD